LEHLERRPAAAVSELDGDEMYFQPDYSRFQPDYSPLSAKLQGSVRTVAAAFDIMGANSSREDRQSRTRGRTMKLRRRLFLQLAMSAAALPAVPMIARAQAYPSRPVTMVVAFPAGGPSDARRGFLPSK
jgi:hypothetical protein